MSILKSYINRNNTIQLNSYVNTGRNPVMELFFGSIKILDFNYGFSRYIFNLDLDLLKEKILDGTISTGCTTGMTHVLNMTNTCKFDNELLNTEMSNGKSRATSFDLILFRIPKTSGDTGDIQIWDEGVGYDFDDYNLTKNTYRGFLTPVSFVDYRAFSTRPSNWYKPTTIGTWSEPGLYNNLNEGNVNFSGLTIIGRQHFEFGNEDINFDMTDEINNILNGSLTGVTGWGIAFLPDVENITGLTQSYSVAFFSRHTQTFYQPYLQTTYDDLVDDDRNNFIKNQINKLYLYIYENGDFINLDEPPFVTIRDREGNEVPGMVGLSSCLRTKGIYEVSVPSNFTSYPTPCEFTDTWTNIKLNGETLEDITNEFILKPTESRIQIGSESKNPDRFGYDFYGVKQNEKILNTDIRKIGVIVKRAYTTDDLLENVEIYYRIYVKEGQTEVQVQDWTKINRTPNEFYFIFDTRDKIPNQYFVDLKLNISGERDTYKRELTFEIVNKK